MLFYTIVHVVLAKTNLGYLNGAKNSSIVGGLLPLKMPYCRVASFSEAGDGAEIRGLS